MGWYPVNQWRVCFKDIFASILECLKEGTVPYVSLDFLFITDFLNQNKNSFE